MKTRRDIFKIAVAGVAASTGIGNASYKEAQSVQPILQDILQTQIFSGPVGVPVLLRYKNDPLSSDSTILDIEKAAIRTKRIKNFNEFDRAEFRKILKKVATKQSHECRSLISISNRVIISSRRGYANIFVVHPEDKKYVENVLKDMKPTCITILIHPDVPKNYALAVYKGSQVYDGAGVFCPMKDAEKSRVGVWTPDLEKYMFLGRFR